MIVFFVDRQQKMTATPTRFHEIQTASSVDEYFNPRTSSRKFKEIRRMIKGGKIRTQHP